LRFVPGTHRWGRLVGKEPHAGIRPDDVQPFDTDLGSESWPIVHVPLRPGSVSFHHSLILHSSSANTSGKRRRGYAVHYMRATTWRNPAVVGAPEMPPFRQVCGRSFPGRV
jgi:ectoine hydroxylase-related dioxygenase (phytanoyl-CoA dioxygenase family)